MPEKQTQKPTKTRRYAAKHIEQSVFICRISSLQYSLLLQQCWWTTLPLLCVCTLAWKMSGHVSGEYYGIGWGMLQNISGKWPGNNQEMIEQCPENPKEMFKQFARSTPKVNSQTLFDLKSRLRTQNYLRMEPVIFQKVLTATISTTFSEAFW